MLALAPHLAAWGKMQIDGALGAAGTNAAAVGLDKLGQVGVLYHGLEVLGGGAILGGLVLGAIGVFVIERSSSKAAAFALAGAVLTFFGFMHGEAVGIGETGSASRPSVALAYLLVAGFLMGCARYAKIEPLAAEGGHRENLDLLQPAPAEQPFNGAAGLGRCSDGGVRRRTRLARRLGRLGQDGHPVHEPGPVALGE